MEKRIIISYEEIAYMQHRLIRFAEERYRLSKNNRERVRCLQILARLLLKKDLSKEDLNFLTSWVSSGKRYIRMWNYIYPVTKQS